MTKKSSGHEKTISIKLLEKRGIPHEIIIFSDTIHDAKEVARITGHRPNEVYKTLVVIDDQSRSKPCLIMIAADTSLDLKKVAQILEVKKARMAKHDEAEKLTGLQVGGISALALINAGFRIYLDENAILLETILVSAGKRGVNLKLPVEALIEVTGASLVAVASHDGDT